MIVCWLTIASFQVVLRVVKTNESYEKWSKQDAYDNHVVDLAT